MAATVTDWSLPYASHRSAVMGRNIVSTSQPLGAGEKARSRPLHERRT